MSVKPEDIDLLVETLGMAPGALVGFHYAIQMTRPRWGHGSDRGGRRTPWIVGGMAVLDLVNAARKLHPNLSDRVVLVGDMALEGDWAGCHLRTLRRTCLRWTPATLPGVSGRPIRACALSTDKDKPLSWD